MKIVNLSHDPQLLKSDSLATKRALAYVERLSSYTIIVPAPHDMSVRHTEKLLVVGVSGSKPIQAYKMLQLVKDLLKSGECDVLSTDQYYLGLIAWLLKWKYCFGWEVQVHGFEKLNWLRRLLTKRILDVAPSIRVNSKRVKDRLEFEFGVSGKHVHVVPIFVDTGHIRLYRKELVDKPEPEKPFKLLTVSRLVLIKNISLQLKALKQLTDEQLAVELHIVGTGPLEAQLKAECQKLGIVEQVHFHGFLTGLPLARMYFESDCFLLTSESEGWGMVLIEAMAANLPVITTDVGCVGEIIEHNKSGLVLDKTELNELVNAVKKMMTDDLYRQQIAAEATKCYEALPSQSAVIDKYVSAWDYAYKNKV